MKKRRRRRRGEAAGNGAPRCAALWPARAGKCPTYDAAVSATRAHLPSPSASGARSSSAQRRLARRREARGSNRRRTMKLKQLQALLEDVEPFARPKVALEQYVTGEPALSQGQGTASSLLSAAPPRSAPRGADTAHRARARRRGGPHGAGPGLRLRHAVHRCGAHGRGTCGAPRHASSPACRSARRSSALSSRHRAAGGRGRGRRRAADCHQQHGSV